MGVKKKNSDTIWTEELIINKLMTHLLSPSTTRYFLNNLYIFSKTWESDFLSLTKSGYFYEGEVKVSRNDFKADFKKENKHLILENTFINKTPENEVLCPHYFFYAVPEGLITKDEIPEYAGLIYMTNVYPFYKWIKQAPLLHKSKYSDNIFNFQDKFYYNMISWKGKAISGYKKELDNVKKLLKESKTDENGKAYPMTLGEYDKLLKIKDEEIEYWKKKYMNLLKIVVLIENKY